MTVPGAPGEPGGPHALPERAADTSAEHPWPVRLLSMKIGEYIERMSLVWVEGQVVQLNRRPGAKTGYLTLRDADVDLSFSVAVRTTTLDAMPPLQPGARVVVQAKATFWPQRGSLMLDARQVRPVGVGELLARLEYLKRVLTAEGLFDADRKQALPFLPRRIGLITGRGSAAEKDVVQNARRRWPAASFDIRPVAVQGVDAVAEVCAALTALDAISEVDVIVIARGGGSVEDLLPFSNETLLRAVASARTPVVSAIGHDVDSPLLDHVADARASTPTDAAKLIVPDAAHERSGLVRARRAIARQLADRLLHERRRLIDLRSRPVLADPTGILRVQRTLVERACLDGGRRVRTDLARARDQVGHLRAQARLLSPHSTLDRGYAIVQRADGHAVRDPQELESAELLKVTVAAGDFGVRVLGDRS